MQGRAGDGNGRGTAVEEAQRGGTRANQDEQEADAVPGHVDVRSIGQHPPD